MLSCPTPTLPPLFLWPWQAPLWWLIWLAFLAIIAYPIRYNYRIYRELQANTDANINRRWFGVFLGAVTIGVGVITLYALVALPGMIGLASWEQQWELRLSNQHCDPSLALSMASHRRQTYALLGLLGWIVLFGTQFPLILLTISLRGKAQAAARRVADADGASAS